MEAFDNEVANVGLDRAALVKKYPEHISVRGKQ
jgi:hypothetical protein